MTEFELKVVELLESIESMLLELSMDWNTDKGFERR